ncbi:MAG: polysaccharide deacetylase family protein [bacterium]
MSFAAFFVENYRLILLFGLVFLTTVLALILHRLKVKAALAFLILILFASFLMGGIYLLDNAVSPRGELFGEVFWRGPKNLKFIALTFDDGPQEPYTSQILNILKSLQVRATFFLIGAKAEKFPGLARRIYAEGHAIGNHTFSHANLLMKAHEGVIGEVKRGEEAIFRATGVSCKIFRPPHGFKNTEVIRACQRRGLTVVGWSEMASDWNEKNPDVIVSKIIERAQNGAIVLLHDGGGDRSRTVEALPEIIMSLQEQGYRFVTIPQMINLKGD